MREEKKHIVATCAVLSRLIKHEIKIDKHYKLYSTSIIRHVCRDNLCPLSDIAFSQFSADEMEQFLIFYNKNSILQSIGFNDSSAVYYAFINKLLLINIDKTTERICHLLGISTITLEDIQYVSNNTNSIPLLPLSVHTTIENRKSDNVQCDSFNNKKCI